MNEISLTALATGTKTESAGYALRAAEAIRSGLEAAEARGLGETARGTLRHEAIEAAEGEIAALVSKELDVVTTKLEGERDAWQRSRERDADRIELRAKTLQRRYDAMTPDEVEREVARILATSEAIEPAELDIVSARLREDGSPIHQAIREAARERELYAGWRHTPEGRELTRKQRHLTNIEPGAFPVEVDGKLVALSLRNLLEEGE